MAQSGGHWHPNPQLMQQHSIPQGWQGTWPPPAGVALPPNFPGPPPMPPGANTHPHWKAGFWQYNPAYNMNAGSGVPWAPGMGWAQNVPANFNPHKRIPRPPSPSYWQTQLSDNGLGLENMVPARTDRDRESTRDVQGDTAPQTPWIWNPPSLLPTDGTDRATPSKDFNNRRSSQDSVRSNSTPTSYGSRHRGSQDSHNTTNTSTPVRDYFYSHPASRHGSVDSLNSRSQGLSQHSISSATPPPPSSHGRTGSIYSSRTPSSGPQYVPPFPAPPSSSSSTSTAMSSLATRIQQPLHAPVFTREPESFMARSDLHTTSSFNAVRTPPHYHGTRRHTDEALDHPSRSSSAPQASASAPSRGLSVPEPLSRHHSLPNTSSPSSIGSLSTFTEDMSSALSPLISSVQRSGATGSLSRSRTEPVIPPAHLSTIPESMSSSSTHSSSDDFFYPLSVPPDSDEESPESSPLRHRVRTREIERERERHHERRRDRSHSYERTNHLTPYNNNSRSSNPLPPPPMERPNLAASAPPPQSPEPVHYTRRIRKGFWNRRGDHLTPNLYVVYAPENRAYPAELQHYPSETDGYKDQYGTFMPYLAERPELPASLPYHGRPPAQPYDSFVIYSYY